MTSLPAPSSSWRLWHDGGNHARVDRLRKGEEPPEIKSGPLSDRVLAAFKRDPTPKTIRDLETELGEPKRMIAYTLTRLLKRGLVAKAGWKQWRLPTR